MVAIKPLSVDSSTDLSHHRQHELFRVLVKFWESLPAELMWRTRSPPLKPRVFRENPLSKVFAFNKSLGMQLVFYRANQLTSEKSTFCRLFVGIDHHSNAD